MTIPKELLDILLCPASGAPLVLDGEHLVSTDPRTRRRYGSFDGIPNLIIEDSEEMPEADWLALMERAGVTPKADGGPARG